MGVPTLRGALSFNPFHLRKQGLGHASAFALACSNVVDMPARDPESLGDPSENALIRNRFTEFPATDSVDSGYGACHTATLYSRTLIMSSEKQSSTRKVANRERGAQIRRLREALGKTPSEFAQGFLGRAGKAMTSQAVWNWENGVNPPSAENYIRMGNTAPDVEQKLHFWEAAASRLSN